MPHQRATSDQVSRRCRAITARHPRLSRWVSAVLVSLLSWPSLDLAPKTGLDPSWGAGVHMATKADLQHGIDLVYTWGPRRWDLG